MTTLETINTNNLSVAGGYKTSGMYEEALV